MPGNEVTGQEAKREAQTLISLSIRVVTLEKFYNALKKEGHILWITRRKLKGVLHLGLKKKKMTLQESASISQGKWKFTLPN